jgi:PAS domain S-box-containing protein
MSVPPQASRWFLPRDSEMARRINEHDWAATPLGPIDGWGPGLRHALATLLRSTAPMGLFHGRDGVFLYNDAYREIAGLRHPQVLGRPILEAWPEVADFNRQVLDTVLGGGTLSYRDVHLVLNRTGEPEDVWLHIDYSPLVEEDGNAGGVFFLIKDTTHRVEMEQRLRIAQHAGGVGTFEWFPETGRLEVSEAYRRLSGLPADGMVTDAMVLARVHPDDRVLAAPAMDRDNPVEYAEYRVVDPVTGEARWIARRGEVARHGEGTRRRFIGIAMDITDRKVAELALANQALTLQDRVNQRTAELLRTQDALRQSQKMEAIGNLTGGVAHDFNNLLQVISGNLQLLVEDVQGNDRGERRVRNAMAGVARGSKLAAQLLAFGRRQPLAPKVVNVGRFVRNMDDLLRRTLGEGIEVETVIAGGLWNTLVDPGNVENALLNLALNARDAMDGQGRLTIEAGNAYLDANYVDALDDVAAGQYGLLAVTDTGHGIEPGILEKVFEPFFTTKPEGQGTGLGLSMVYGFVKQSGGHIKLYSEPGHGTTVKLYLPRTTQSEDIIVDVDTGPVTGGSETVLVAEDDEAVRETVVAMLADLGYRVLKARDAHSALSIIESGIPIDLLFTDVVMPGALKSPELARKARERLPGIAVLFTSGYTENSIVHGGRLDEGVELLSKPYTRETLARKLRQMLMTQAQRNAGNPETVVTAPAVPTPPPIRVVRVLVVEDDWLVRTTVAEMLQLRGHEVFEAGDANRALEILGEETIDVLISDVNLPGMSGVELVATARERQADLAAVYATGHAGVDGVEPDARTLVLVKPYGSDALNKSLAQLFPPPGIARPMSSPL